MKKMFYVLLALLVSMVLVFGVSCDNSNKAPGGAEGNPPVEEPGTGEEPGGEDPAPEPEPEGPEFTIQERTAISKSIMGLFINNLSYGVEMTTIEGYAMAVIVSAEDGVSDEVYTMLKDSKAGINGLVDPEKGISITATLTTHDGTTYYVNGKAETSTSEDDSIDVVSSTLQMTKTVEGVSTIADVEDEVITSLIASLSF